MNSASIHYAKRRLWRATFRYFAAMSVVASLIGVGFAMFTREQYIAAGVSALCFGFALRWFLRVWSEVEAANEIFRESCNARLDD